jgi:hypothetical protein
MFNGMLTIFVGSRETPVVYGVSMDAPFIKGRLALTDAAELIECYGDHAPFEAAARADRSRDEGNVMRFCHWRHIERLVAALNSDEVYGTVH